MGDPTRLILVDEADRLKMANLEQMRAIFDAGGIGLVLIGMPGRLWGAYLLKRSEFSRSTV
jgi:DNA transposition AAA+ family ATPase